MKNTIKKISLGSVLLILSVAVVDSASAQTNRQPVKNSNEVRIGDQNKANKVNRTSTFRSKSSNSNVNAVNQSNNGNTSSQRVNGRTTKAKNEVEAKNEPVNSNSVNYKKDEKPGVITDKKVNVRSSSKPAIIAPGNNQKSNSSNGKSGN